MLKRLLSLVPAALLVPAFCANAETVGSEASPYKISSPKDLNGLAAAATNGAFYVSVEDDIDMSGVSFKTIDKPNTIFHINGNCHTISNITYDGGSNNYAALFTSFSGSIKNLGLENINTSSGGYGVAGSFVAYVTGSSAVIENCYATGSASGFYAGGLVGGLQNNSGLTIRSCYANVKTTASSGFAGGITGPCNPGSTLNVEYVYAAGNVSAAAWGCGITAMNSNYSASEKRATVNLSNVAVFSASITSTYFAEAIVGTAPYVTVNVTNGLVSDNTLVKGKTVNDCVARDALANTVMGWPGFNAQNLDEVYNLPVLEWQSGDREIVGDSEDNPIVISRASELAKLQHSLIPDGVTYVVFDNDIDMDGIVYNTVSQVANVNIDGRGHVIRNFAPRGAFAGMFAEIDGTVRNLGFENVNIEAGSWGAAGAIAAYVGSTAPATIENCFVTGSVTAYYSGGLAGGTRHGVTIRNCYSQADVYATDNGIAGGILGTICFIAGGTNTANLINCYASGSIVGLSAGGGLVGSNQTYGHPAGATEVLNITNGAAFNPVINGTTTGYFAAIDKDTPLTLNATGTIYLDDMTVNDQLIEGGEDEQEMIRTVMAWEGFNHSQTNPENGHPILAWQTGKEVSGITDIIADDADAPAVYYNLQGVQIKNPGNGIYIVRRGNKVTKEFIK